MGDTEDEEEEPLQDTAMVVHIHLQEVAAAMATQVMDMREVVTVVAATVAHTQPVLAESHTMEVTVDHTAEKRTDTVVMMTTELVQMTETQATIPETDITIPAEGTEVTATMRMEVDLPTPTPERGHEKRATMVKEAREVTEVIARSMAGAVFRGRRHQRESVPDHVLQVAKNNVTLA